MMKSSKKTNLKNFAKKKKTIKIMKMRSNRKKNNGG